MFLCIGLCVVLFADCILMCLCTLLNLMMTHLRYGIGKCLFKRSCQAGLPFKLSVGRNNVEFSEGFPQTFFSHFNIHKLWLLALWLRFVVLCVRITRPRDQLNIFLSLTDYSYIESCYLIDECLMATPMHKEYIVFKRQFETSEKLKDILKRRTFSHIFISSQNSVRPLQTFFGASSQMSVGTFTSIITLAHTMMMDRDSRGKQSFSSKRETPIIKKKNGHCNHLTVQLRFSAHNFFLFFLNHPMYLSFEKGYLRLLNLQCNKSHL